MNYIPPDPELIKYFFLKLLNIKMQFNLQQFKKNLTIIMYFQQIYLKLYKKKIFSQILNGTYGIIICWLKYFFNSFIFFFV